jgi:hypothetical protein
MASIDPLSMAMGSAPARSIDPLGYYSPTLEAALKLAQNKGTPEQMLAQLKKAGAKDSEIEVSGLKKMFEGKKAVTKDEIVKALEEGKVGLEEKVYSNQPAPDWIDGYAKNAGYPSGQAMADAQGVSLSQVQSDAIEMFGPPQSTTKYADYSLDPQNPTYREVVLHLPESSAVGRMKEAYEAAQKRYQAAVAKQDQIDRRKPVMTPEEQAVIDEVKAAQAELQAASQPVADLNFRSGHFDEPNIVGHMMVSETRLPGNPQARVLTLDQVQSDWGQKIRDGGVRDEGKIQELKSKIAEIEQVTGPIRAEHERYGKELLNRIDPGSRASVDGGLFSATKDRSLPEEVRKEASAWLSRAYDLNNNDATRLLYAELRTAEAATPGHPLVNTTDQWLNTTLRRAIRMAAEEGQDYIAMPSGKTMYAAQEAGMGSSVGDKARSGIVSFYGGMPEEMGEVMSNLKQAATKAPNESVINVLDAKTIDALASSGILDKKKIENISAARVLKNAEARFQGIVPKNLYALLQKLDKNTPPPQAIDTLDSPSGKTGLGEGFTLFKITPEAKKAAKESGQPLFRFGGRVA